MKVGIATDHGGFGLKEELAAQLRRAGHEVVDFGAHKLESDDDYPDYVAPLAKAVASGQVTRGIAICGSGVGASVCANKVPGIRAAACYSVDIARNSREHNDANVLTLGSKAISDAEMRDIVRTWLATEITEERHRKRVAKISAIERQYRC